MVSGVLVIVPYKVLPLINAGHRGSVLYAEALSKHTNVFLASTKDIMPSNEFAFTPLKIFSTNRWIKYLNVFYFFTLLRIVRKNKISHIVFEQPYLPLIFLLFRFFTNAKCIYHSHNIEYQRFQSYDKKVWLLLYCFELLHYKLAHLTHSVSPDDILFAKEKFGISANKIVYIPASIRIDTVPTDSDLCKEKLRKQYNIKADETLLFFNGSLNYPPNQNAIDIILSTIIPALNEQKFAYKILICGSKLPPIYNHFKANPEIIYAAFVDDIAFHNKGVDMMINPVIEGGGVKVKLLDALSYNLPCISTESGAKGISKELCGQQLHCVEDNDWKNFTNAIIEQAKKKQTTIPNDFYDCYTMSAIGKKAFLSLSSST